MHSSASMVTTLFLVFAASAAGSQGDIDWETYWPGDETDKIIEDINDGELNFLVQPPGKPVHHLSFPKTHITHYHAANRS